jgi:hypothetical protein
VTCTNGQRKNYPDYVELLIERSTSAVAPKKVMELSKSSAKLVKEIEHITNSLDIEIEFVLKKLA